MPTMAPKAKHTNLLTPKDRLPLKWYIVLQRVGDEVRIQPDWRKEVRVGDTIQFVSPDGHAKVEFEPAEGVDENGRPVTRFPLGTAHKTVEEGEAHEVIHSCKGVIQCSIVLRNGATLGYHSEKEGQKATAEEEPKGTNYCWKGGQLSVVCP